MHPCAGSLDAGVLPKTTLSIAQRDASLRGVGAHAIGGLFQGATLTAFFHRFTICVLSQNGEPSSLEGWLMQKTQRRSRKSVSDLKTD